MADQPSTSAGQPSTTAAESSITAGEPSTTADQPSTTAAKAKCHNPNCPWPDNCVPFCSDCDHLPLCAGCYKVHYCCEECQNSDWKDHRVYCKHISSQGASSASFGAMQYYEMIALHDPAALALARDLHLALPAPGSSGSGYHFKKLMRRLIVTGRDTPENIRLFFGSGGGGARSAELARAHAENRMEVLLRPPAGSAQHAEAAALGLDGGCPVENWTPREPSVAEAGELRTIRSMQNAIRRRMGAPGTGTGPGGVVDPTEADMAAILAEQCGNRHDQPESLRIYRLALHSMDRGIVEGKGVWPAE
ncbi:hypothetical protein SLS62_009029 [Diatrype stigma]|uniref:MYND-type domain-containing protein n=1 Tax=Diatrype stigma TaxID=117547 RepID=A0AAN9YJQ6_9PEZI